MNGALASGWSVVAWGGLLAALVQIAASHRRLRGASPTGALGWVWRALAAIGFAVTWTFMLKMAREDLARYASLADWSRDSNLFFDAYRRVTGTPAAWWWSEQLMAWALAGTLWFCVEGQRRGIRFWSYLWLAMCVAVSVALPLFERRRSAEKEVHPAARVPVLVFVGIVVATVGLVVTPFVSGRSFLLAMLVLHGGLLIPAMMTSRAPQGSRGIDPRRAAWVVGVACFALHVVATLRLHAAPVRALFEVVASDPAQASITSDLALTWVVCALIVATTRGRRAALGFLLLAPVVSLGAAFAWATASRAPFERGFGFARGVRVRVRGLWT